MARDRKLKAALDRFQGKDRKVFKDRKDQKASEKEAAQKREKKQATAAASAVDAADKDGKDDDEDDFEDIDEDDSDNEDVEPSFDVDQLNESDSESELDVEDEDIDEHEDSEEEEAEDADDIPLSDIDDDGSDQQDIVPHQRLTINNTAALDRALASIKLPLASMAFSEHQSIITPEPIIIEDVNDDLNRELSFYAQSLAAVKDARARLRKEGVPFSRPTDYFAEMVKSDEHMGKIKGKLLEEAASKKASQDAKKQRELKKFGKQVQQERLKERAAAKRDMLDKVKMLKRKRQDGGLDTANEEDMFDVALEDAAETSRKDKDARKSQRPGAPNYKRQKKDEKFGFGGKKRFSKSNDAKSSGDMRGYSTKKMKAGAKASATRPGKARRQKARLP